MVADWDRRVVYNGNTGYDTRVLQVVLEEREEVWTAQNRQ